MVALCLAAPDRMVTPSAGALIVATFYFGNAAPLWVFWRPLSSRSASKLARASLTSISSSVVVKPDTSAAPLPPVELQQRQQQQLGDAPHPALDPAAVAAASSASPESTSVWRLSVNEKSGVPYFTNTTEELLVAAAAGDC